MPLALCLLSSLAVPFLLFCHTLAPSPSCTVPHFWDSSHWGSLAGQEDESWAVRLEPQRRHSLCSRPLPPPPQVSGPFLGGWEEGTGLGQAGSSLPDWRSAEGLPSLLHSLSKISPEPPIVFVLGLKTCSGAYRPLRVAFGQPSSAVQIRPRATQGCC